MISQLEAGEEWWKSFLVVFISLRCFLDFWESDGASVFKNLKSAHSNQLSSVAGLADVVSLRNLHLKHLPFSVTK